MVNMLILTLTLVSGDAAPPTWTIYVANDNCPDYTWGLTEAATRQAFADVVRGHLDEMRRTDDQPPGNRDRYNMAVTNEALCFLERYPDRAEEMFARVREGRLYVSPYLCNSLWAFQSLEGAIRTFYPARRLERRWGGGITCAHHIELPSLPWSTASILAGCGMRALTIPYLGYDTTFGSLRTPPLVTHEGPDGSRVALWLDRWASEKANYTQGAAVLRKPERIAGEWIPHYAALSAAYPLRAILASGTHGDISPSKGDEARGFAEALIAYNGRTDAPARLVNAVFPQFWEAVEAAKPTLPVVRGSFGHSWDAWPVSLAAYAGAMRVGERRFLAAEALLAFAACARPELIAATRPARERAEWCWAMLSDHAWNGTDDANRRHNAELRRAWAEELGRHATELTVKAWQGLGLAPASSSATVFNPSSVVAGGVVCLEATAGANGVRLGEEELPSQMIEQEGRRTLCALVPILPGYSFRELALTETPWRPFGTDVPTAAAERLVTAHFRVTPDPKTGGLASIVWAPNGVELLQPERPRTAFQTIYYDGAEHVMAGATVSVVEQGPVLARLKIAGEIAGIGVATYVTAYASLDRLDIDTRIVKQPSGKEERLCQALPFLGPGMTLRIAETGAAIRPRPEPEGDLVPGADTRRFAVGEFVSFARPGLSVTVVPVEPFLLRLDLGVPMIEALGNDQNHREVARDQNGETQFRLRYSLTAQAGDWSLRDALGFSQEVLMPFLVASGSLPAGAGLPIVAVDHERAIATCLKPADEGEGAALCLRLWSTSELRDPFAVELRGFAQVFETDLLERAGRPLALEPPGLVRVAVPPRGYAAVRLVR